LRQLRTARPRRGCQIGAWVAQKHVCLCRRLLHSFGWRAVTAKRAPAPRRRQRSSYLHCCAAPLSLSTIVVHRSPAPLANLGPDWPRSVPHRCNFSCSSKNTTFQGGGRRKGVRGAAHTATGQEAIYPN
jgi:hypothetical protein